MRPAACLAIVLLAIPAAQACSIAAPPEVPNDFTFAAFLNGTVQTNLGNDRIAIDPATGQWHSIGDYANNRFGRADPPQPKVEYRNNTGIFTNPVEASPTGAVSLRTLYSSACCFCVDFVVGGFELLDASGNVTARFVNATQNGGPPLRLDVGGRIGLVDVVHGFSTWIEWNGSGATEVVPFNRSLLAPYYAVSPASSLVLTHGQGRQALLDAATGVVYPLALPAEAQTQYGPAEPEGVAPDGAGLVVRASTWVGRVRLVDGMAVWSDVHAVPNVDARWSPAGILVVRDGDWQLVGGPAHALEGNETMRHHGWMADGSLWILTSQGKGYWTPAARFLHVGADGAILAEMRFHAEDEPSGTNAAPAPSLLAALILGTAVLRRRLR